MNPSELIETMKNNGVYSITIHSSGTVHLIGRHGSVNTSAEDLSINSIAYIANKYSEIFTDFDPSKPN